MQAIGTHSSSIAAGGMSGSTLFQHVLLADANTSSEARTSHVAADTSASDATDANTSGSDAASKDPAQQLSIPEALHGRTVLLTGATGFVGSVVLEQLLRTCPDVHKVFVLVRQKRGVAAHTRIRQLLSTNPLFHLLRCTAASDAPEHSHSLPVNTNNGAEFDSDGIRSCIALKVQAVPGDITLPGLGIGGSDLLKLQAEVEVVIHAAASISFDDHIHDAITHNYMVRSALLALLLHGVDL